MNEFQLAIRNLRGAGDSDKLKHFGRVRVWIECTVNSIRFLKIIYRDSCSRVGGVP
jgi:hypothetical protein